MAVVLGGSAASVATVARAGVLYKCGTADGSIAYTSTRKGYTECKAIAAFADAPKTRAAVAPTSAPAQAPRHGWVYQENRADFSGVEAAVASAPASIVRANFSAVAASGSSSAATYVAQDFSTVQADVASSAALVGNPLFIASPYRQALHRATARNVAAVAVSSSPASAPDKPRVLRGAVYKVERKGGIVEYTNIRPAGNAFAVLFTYIATCVACDIHSTIDFARTALNLDAYKTEIAAAAADYGVDGALLRAVIHAESAFNPMALSNKGAQGLMQLMPGTAGDLGVTDAFDAAQNIRGGARYLARLLKDFNGNSQLATAAYNAGEGAVQKYRGVPPYDETQVYVQRVATLRDRYQKAM